jgi:hypothetical protein
MFHVKHTLPVHFDVVVDFSFTNTKIAKDHVQNILDIDSASESAERGRSRAQVLCDQLLTVGVIPDQRPIERRYGFLQRSLRSMQNKLWHRLKEPH